MQNHDSDNQNSAIKKAKVICVLVEYGTSVNTAVRSTPYGVIGTLPVRIVLEFQLRFMGKYLIKVTCFRVSRAPSPLMDSHKGSYATYSTRKAEFN